MHLFDNLFAEQPRLARNADHHRRMRVLHHVQQGNILRVYLPAANGVARGKQVFLEIEQVGHVVGQQAEAIDHKDPAARFRLGQAVIHH